MTERWRPTLFPDGGAPLSRPGRVARVEISVVWTSRSKWPPERRARALADYRPDCPSRVAAWRRHSTHAGQPPFPASAAPPTPPTPPLLPTPTSSLPRSASERGGCPIPYGPSAGHVCRAVDPGEQRRMDSCLAWVALRHIRRGRRSTGGRPVARVPVAHLAYPSKPLSRTTPRGLIGPAFRTENMLVWVFTAGASRSCSPGRLVLVHGHTEPAVDLPR